MGDWEKFKETLFEKEDFYSNLCLENIPGGDQRYTKRVWKEFEIKNQGECHDLYVHSDKFLPSDVFRNFGNVSENIWTSIHSFYLCTWTGMGRRLEKDQSTVRTINQH